MEMASWWEYPDAVDDTTVPGKLFTKESGYYWDTRTQKYILMEEAVAMEGHTMAQLAEQVLRAIPLFAQTKDCFTVQECLRYVDVEPGETYKEWAQRHNIPLICRMQKRVYSDFGLGNTDEMPAAQALMMDKDKFASNMAYRLHACIKKGTLSIERLHPVCQEWMSFLDREGFGNFLKVIKGGYRKMFGNIVDRGNFAVRLDTEVIKVLRTPSDPDGFPVHIHFRSMKDDGSSQYIISEGFDEVIVASRPQQSASFLAADDPARELLSRVGAENTSDGVYQLALCAIKGYPLPLGKCWMFPGPFGLGNEVHAIGSKKAGTITGIVYRFGNGIVIVGMQTTPELAGSREQEENMIRELKAMGVTACHVLQTHTYPCAPSVLPSKDVKDGWYDAMDQIQGEGGMFFVGEIFTGHGVTNTVVGTKKMVEIFSPAAARMHHKAPTEAEPAKLISDT